MAIFVLKKKWGIAVINARDPDEALSLLEEKENRDDCVCLSHQAKPEDFKPLGNNLGVLAYFATG